MTENILKITDGTWDIHKKAYNNPERTGEDIFCAGAAGRN